MNFKFATSDVSNKIKNFRKSLFGYKNENNHEKESDKSHCNKSRFLSADFYAPFEKPLSTSGLAYIYIK